MQSQVKIVIVDDSAEYRYVLKTILQTQLIEIIGEAANDEELQQLIGPDVMPDVAIVNYKSSKADGLNSIEWLRHNYPSVKLLVNSMHAVPIHYLQEIGAGGYFVKSRGDFKEIIQAIQIIHAGGQYFNNAPVNVPNRDQQDGHTFHV